MEKKFWKETTLKNAFRRVSTARRHYMETGSIIDLKVVRRANRMLSGLIEVYAI